MIELLRKLLPYCFILYFFVKGNKEPLYFLGIPFLMFMSNSIFFDGVQIFAQPFNLSYALILIWLTIFWVLARFTRPNQKKNNLEYTRKLNSLDFCIIGLMILSVSGLVTTIIHFKVPDVLEEFIHLISLFAGYFIIKDWISRNEPELVTSFLYSLIVINTVACILFLIHQGAGIHIYPEKESIEAYFEGQDITRSFWFAPQFLFFSISFLFIFREKYPKTYLPLLIINLLAVFITYTRSYITIIVVIFLMYFLLTGLKKKNVGLVFKNILIFSIIGIFGIFILSKILPAKTKYFMDRFNELSTPSTSQDPNNLQFRFIHTGNIISHMDANSKVLGEGPVTEKQSDWVPDMELATSDMVWTGVIFRWGFVGLFFFILLYILSIVQAFKFYMNSQGLLSDLALFLLIYIVSQILESFVSWTFLSEHGLATGLWYFAALSWITGFRTNEKNSIKKTHFSWNFG